MQKEYENWFFDPKEFKKYEENLALERESEREKLKEAEAVIAEQKTYVCSNKDCPDKKPVPVKECEHCGQPTEEVKDRVAPSIFVSGGASPGRV